MYKNRESLIMYQDFDEYLDIVTFYKADLDCEHFCQRSCRTLVHGLPTKKVETVSLAECGALLQGLMQKSFYCEVCQLAKLILVMPATNAVSERIFSATRHLKTYLCM